MSMPHQIFCDFLEDKGIDTRLLRSLECDCNAMLNLSVISEVFYSINCCIYFDDDGDSSQFISYDRGNYGDGGNAWGYVYGSYDGDGYTYYDDGEHPQEGVFQ